MLDSALSIFFWGQQETIIDHKLGTQLRTRMMLLSLDGSFLSWVDIYLPEAMYYKQTFLFLMMELFRYRYRQDLQTLGIRSAVDSGQKGHGCESMILALGVGSKTLHVPFANNNALLRSGGLGITTGCCVVWFSFFLSANVWTPSS